MKSCLHAAVFLFAGLLTIPGSAADQQTIQRANFAAAGFKAGRARLRSGVFRAVGQLDWPDDPPLKGKIKVFGAFDFDKGLQRFDREEPIWLAPPAGSPSSAKMKLSKTGGKFAMTNDRTIHWFLRSHLAYVDRPEKQASASKPFDVRLIGFGNWWQLSEAGTEWNCVDRVFATNVHDAVIEEESLYHVSWVYPQGFRFDFWFDAARDFVPVRMEERHGPPTADGEWPSPVEIDEAKWTRINGVWVPSWFIQNVVIGDPRKRELSFEWESVNKPVNEELFTWKAFGLPNGTRVWDRRLGKPIQLGIVGGGDVRAQDFAEGSQRTTYVFWLLVGTVFVVGVALLLLRVWTTRASST